ncbi:probable L-cysteine desulfhydrase, chloroplastic [Branchiostoma floridae]|uniref:Probable L-cysteine desulfhydrase, chloroplastic n=1 Tax=Branchiostoma floridae TaxID=7739 RepID=A0A9J7LH72_BRAFL|nr:probable L-cysteine desulfhydrase, chloroplastic [Branchiostoma floridae]
MEFGVRCREDHFLFEAGTAMCNHGSYGAIPRKVREKQQSLHLEIERTPDRWFRETTPRLFQESVSALAEFVGAKKENLMFIQNPTTAVNSVLKSFPFQPGDAVLVSNLTYGAVRFTAEVIKTYAPGAECVALEISPPVTSAEQIVQLYRDTLEKHPNIKLAVIDTITSPTAVAMPVADLVSLCHMKGVQVMLDGAHSPGQQELQLEELGADYYTGTVHKWLFAPRGCAFLWVRSDHHATVRPLVTSWFFQKDLQHQFHMQGTRDDSAYFCSPEAINFHQQLGGLVSGQHVLHSHSIMEYSTKLRKDATKLLLEGWKTETLGIPESLQAPYMECIKLPLPQTPGAESRYPPTPRGAMSLQYDMYQQHGVQCAVVCMLEALWVRISAFVYNSREDYTRLRDAVLALMSRQDFPDFPGPYWPYLLVQDTQ